MFNETIICYKPLNDENIDKNTSKITLNDLSDTKQIYYSKL